MEVSNALAYFGAALGLGLIVIGAGLGIGRVGGQAVEGMARQPEIAGKIQTAALIFAASEWLWRTALRRYTSASS